MSPPRERTWGRPADPGGAYDDDEIAANPSLVYAPINDAPAHRALGVQAPPPGRTFGRKPIPMAHDAPSPIFCSRCAGMGCVRCGHAGWMWSDGKVPRACTEGTTPNATCGRKHQCSACPHADELRIRVPVRGPAPPQVERVSKRAGR